MTAPWLSAVNRQKLPSILLPVLLFEKCQSWFTKSAEEPSFGRILTAVPNLVLSVLEQTDLNHKTKPAEKAATPTLEDGPEHLPQTLR